MLVATIDHGLRNESAKEAQFVSECAKALGLEHRIARWHDVKPIRGIPAAAREARYRHLENIAGEFSGGDHVALAVAHTLDDQAETFLMRLQRGAGVEGLRAMAPERLLYPGSRVMLVRPLLDIPKSRLLASLRQRGITSIEDPTNSDMDFERPRIRSTLSAMRTHGVVASALAASAARLRKADDAIAFAEPLFAHAVDLRIDREIFASMDAPAFASGPRLLRERLLARLIARFGGATPVPELREVEDLAARLETQAVVRATLGGTVVSQGHRYIRVWREVGRIKDTPLILDPAGRPTLWDQRFWVAVEGDVTVPIHVSALGTAGLAAVRERAGPDERAALDAAPARALAALPAFFCGAELAGVPGLNRQHPPGMTLKAHPSHSD